MGACLSKKQGSSSSSSASKPVSATPPSKLENPENGVTITLPKPTNPEANNLKKEKKTTVQERQQDPVAAAPAQEVVETQVKKEIFIIKHRKSHDENRERGSKIQPFNAQQNVAAHSDDGSPSDSAESMGNNNNNNKIAPPTPNMGVVRTSSCTKEEVDAILIQCGRLSRSSSGRAATSSHGVERGRKYSGSKRSFDFDHCENDSTSADGDQKRAADNNSNSDLCEDYDGAEKGGSRSSHQHRQRHRQSPRPSSPSSQGGGGRRRTPSRERDQRSSSRERRVSRSPGRRSSETTANGSNANNGCSSNNNNNAGSRPGKMVSVPATVTSLVMDKSNNGGGESAGVKRITVKRNVGVGDGGVVGSRGSASPRSQSPARGNGNGRALSENQQPSLSRNNSTRKAEHSPYRRNPLSEIDPNSLAYPQSNANNGSSKMQNRPKKETEPEANQKPYAMDKGVSVNCKPKEQQEEDTKAMASMNDINNVVVKTLVPSSSSSIIDNNIMKPQSLTRSRSSRRSRDLDINPESLLNNNPPPTQSYTTLLLEDIQNFHQKNTQQQQQQQQPSPSISLPACLSKACSILEAVADLNSTTSSNNNVSFGGANNNSNHYGKKRVVAYDAKDPFVESEVLVSDDVMEPSFHKYVTVKRGGSVLGVDMEDQESSGSNSFTVSSGQQQQQHWGGIGISTSSWEPNSADSTDDCSWTSRLMMIEGGSDDVIGAKRNKNVLKCKRRECDDHQHSSGIGRGRIVVTTAATT